MRNQVRKAEKSGLTVAHGGEELLPEFYSVFSRNMRDLGTPVYGAACSRPPCGSPSPPEETRGCVVVRAEPARPSPPPCCCTAGASRRSPAPRAAPVQPTCANMLLYWKLLERAVERGQAVFDFGRSTIDGTTYRFKKQWGRRAGPGGLAVLPPRRRGGRRTTRGRKTRATSG